MNLLPSTSQYYDLGSTQPSTPVTGQIIGGRGLDVEGYAQFTGELPEKTEKELQRIRQLPSHREGGIVFQFTDPSLFPSDNYHLKYAKIDSNTVGNCISNLRGGNAGFMDNLRIVGISLTNVPSCLDEVEPPTSPFVSQSNPQGPNLISVLATGTTSIINTGEKLIKAFEHVVVTYPDLHDETNHVIQLEYKNAMDPSSISKRRRIEKDYKLEDYVLPTIFSISQERFKQMNPTTMYAVQRRYLGQARECANPGEKFNIFINPQCPLASSLHEIGQIFG
jgi:hypothetical protein